MASISRTRRSVRVNAIFSSSMGSSAMSIWVGKTRTSPLLRDLGSFTRLIQFDKRGTGVSDREVSVATLEERMDDLRAVMDAADSERAVVMGISEGVPMSILFAATYPQRTDALILHGGMARSTWAPDYPWAAPAEALVQGSELIAPGLFTGDDIEIWAPSLRDDPQAKQLLGRWRRASVSPAAMRRSSPCSWRSTYATCYPHCACRHSCFIVVETES